MKFKNLKTNAFVNAIGQLAKDLSKDKNYRLAVDADFKESDHPRDKNGKFGSGGGSSGNLHSDFEFKDRVTEAAKKNKFKTKSISTQTGVKTGFEADMSDLSSFVQEFTSDKKDPLFYTNFVSKIHEIAKESGFKQIHMNENGRSSIGFDFDHDDLEKFAKKIKSTKFN